MEKRDNVKEEVIEKGDDIYATELIDLIKYQAKKWFTAFCIMTGVAIASIAVTIAIVFRFVHYLDQYDFTGNIEQSGVYTLIDSSGNVISSDITPEDIEKIMEIINNGENENNKKEN